MTDDPRGPDAPDRRKPLRPKLRCPICGDATISHVIDCRPGPTFFWRRRRCDACRETFTTTEIIDAIDRPPAQDVVRG